MDVAKKITREQFINYTMTLQDKKDINSMYMDLQTRKEGPHIIEEYIKTILIILKHPPKTRTQEEIEILQKTTAHFKIFQEYNAKKKYREHQVHQRICSALTYQYVKNGQRIIRQGDYGDKMYIILKGKAQVYLQKEPKDMQDKRMKSTFFYKPQQIHHEIQKYHNLVKQFQEDKDEWTERRAEATLESIHDKFNEAAEYQIDAKELDLLKVDDIFEYIVNGVFAERYIATLGQGNLFGELALTFNAPRAASVVAVEDTHLCVLDKKKFNEILAEFEKQRNEKMLGVFYTALNIQVSRSTMLRIAHSFKKRKFKFGQDIFQAGDKSDGIYIIKKGEVRLYSEVELPTVYDNYEKKPEDIPEAISNYDKKYAMFPLPTRPKKKSVKFPLEVLSEGNLLGEDIVLKQKHRLFSATPHNGDVKLFYITKQAFQDLIWSYVEFRWSLGNIARGRQYYRQERLDQAQEHVHYLVDNNISMQDPQKFDENTLRRISANKIENVFLINQKLQNAFHHFPQNVEPKDRRCSLPPALPKFEPQKPPKMIQVKTNNGIQPISIQEIKKLTLGDSFTNIQHMNDFNERLQQEVNAKSPFKSPFENLHERGAMQRKLKAKQNKESQRSSSVPIIRMDPDGSNKVFSPKKHQKKYGMSPGIKVLTMLKASEPYLPQEQAQPIQVNYYNARFNDVNLDLSPIRNSPDKEKGITFSAVVNQLPLSPVRIKKKGEEQQSVQKEKNQNGNENVAAAFMTQKVEEVEETIVDDYEVQSKPIKEPKSKVRHSSSEPMPVPGDLSPITQHESINFGGQILANKSGKSMPLMVGGIRPRVSDNASQNDNTLDFTSVTDRNLPQQKQELEQDTVLEEQNEQKLEDQNKPEQQNRNSENNPDKFDENQDSQRVIKIEDQQKGQMNPEIVKDKIDEAEEFQSSQQEQKLQQQNEVQQQQPINHFTLQQQQKKQASNTSSNNGIKIPISDSTQTSTNPAQLSPIKLPSNPDTSIPHFQYHNNTEALRQKLRYSQHSSVERSPSSSIIQQNPNFHTKQQQRLKGHLSSLNMNSARQSTGLDFDTGRDKKSTNRSQLKVLGSQKSSQISSILSSQRDDLSPEKQPKMTNFDQYPSNQPTVASVSRQQDTNYARQWTAEEEKRLTRQGSLGAGSSVKNTLTMDATSKVGTKHDSYGTTMNDDEKISLSPAKSVTNSTKPFPKVNKEFAKKLKQTLQDTSSVRLNKKMLIPYINMAGSLPNLIEEPTMNTSLNSNMQGDEGVMKLPAQNLSQRKQPKIGAKKEFGPTQIVRRKMISSLISEKKVDDSYFSKVNDLASGPSDQNQHHHDNELRVGKGATVSVIATDREIKKSKHNMFRFRMKREGVGSKPSKQQKIQRSNSSIQIDSTATKFY